MKHLPNRWALTVWVVLAAGSTAGAVLLGPWVIPPLDAKQEQFRDKLESGIGLLRLDLAAAAVLSLASLALWRPGTDAALSQDARPPVSAKWAWLGSLLLAAIFAALAVPRLGTTLWWDELITLSTVKRGPVVILTFSGNANNHPLNSLLIWASLRGLAENEVVLHLTPFLFSLAAIQLLFWTMLRVAGLRIALLAGLAAATHPSLINHAVEARGYAGAILFTWAAMVVFARLLTTGSVRWTVLYIACCVTAFGFIATTILVPFAHGALACVLLLASYRRAELATYRTNALNIIFACLWVPVLSVLLFGLPLPQTLTYARELASTDHHPLGWPLAGQVLVYEAGLRELIPAVLMAGIASLGWWAAFSTGRPQLAWLAVSSLAPVAAAGMYVLLPHAHSSARFFCFLLLPCCCGFGLGLDWLLRFGSAGRLVFVLVALGWLGLLGAEHQRLFLINRPDLKTLGRELHGTRVLLIGDQADVNTYYLPEATSYQEKKSQKTLEEAVAQADVVVEGRARRDNRLDEPDARLTALGFRVEKTLANAVDGTEYLVYRRGSR